MKKPAPMAFKPDIDDAVRRCGAFYQGDIGDVIDRSMRPAKATFFDENAVQAVETPEQLKCIHPELKPDKVMYWVVDTRIRMKLKNCWSGSQKIYRGSIDHKYIKMGVGLKCRLKYVL